MGLAQFIADHFSQFSRRCCRSIEPERGSDRWLGAEGERLACGFLRGQGFKILYRNFRAPHGGEVDLVCRDKSCDTLVFVEVKTRRGAGFGAPAEAVTRSKQQLIVRGALAWLRMLDRPGIPVRFDVVEIVVTDGHPAFNLIKDAFPVPDYYIP